MPLGRRRANSLLPAEQSAENASALIGPLIEPKFIINATRTLACGTRQPIGDVPRRLEREPAYDAADRNSVTYADIPGQVRLLRQPRQLFMKEAKMADLSDPRKSRIQRNAQNHFALVEKRDNKLRHEQQKAQAAEAAKMAKLRALRLAKEAADKEKASKPD